MGVWVREKLRNTLTCTESLRNTLYSAVQQVRERLRNILYSSAVQAGQIEREREREREPS